MAKQDNINLDFRPDSYWDDPDALLANVKGEFRRRQLLQAIEEGELDEVPPPIFGDSLPEHLRSFTGSIHPSLMGGEYLPDYEENEVEIARVALDSTTADVITVRARPDSKVIRYRVVDEYDSKYILDQDRSNKPLTLGKLVSLMETVECVEFESRGLVTHHWEYMAGDGDCDLDESVAFTSVSSEFYPQLAEYYEQKAEEWIAERKSWFDDDCDEDGGAS
jgi:hypothetical protein